MPDQTFMLKSTQLEIKWPDGKIETLEITSDLIQIGREIESAGLLIPTDYASILPVQCEIQKGGFRYRLVDPNQSNLVMVNGKVAYDEILSHDDLITIGDPAANQQIEIRFIFPAGALIEQQSTSSRRMSDAPDMGEAAPPTEGAYFEINTLGGAKRYFSIKSKTLVIGRSENADLKIPEVFSFVSANHAELRKNDDGFQILDLGSSNGTMVNGWILGPNTKLTLRAGDVIRLGDQRFGVSISLKFMHVESIQNHLGFTATQSFVNLKTVLSKQTRIIIGRDQKTDLVLDSPRVSREHAQLEFRDGCFFIRDLHSTNGTFLNGKRIELAEITENDQIEIGTHTLFFQKGELHQYENLGVRLDVVDLAKEVNTKKGKLRILDDIDMTVLPRDFIAIVGGSGAGKTTLMNALLGVDPGEGHVLINGHNYYEEIDKFRDQIGYVPQSDILHMALTVEKALDYAAQLRLPNDVTKAERKERIANVLETVSMNTDVIRQTQIKKLSGGQRKRISIAAELLADPKLLYLDEPTSGLDPGLEKKMMYTLRRMADQGRTVVLITHATANIVQVDHVAFLSQGQLVYFGPPNEALDFFEVEDFADIYERIENYGDHWRDVFTNKKKDYYEKYIVSHQETRRFLPIPETVKKFGSGIQLFFKQLFILSRRSFNIQSSDIITLALLAALYPFTALLQLLISTPSVMIGDLAIMADPIAAAKIIAETYAPLIDTRLFVFITGLEAVLIGMYVPSNELILERNIYLRERMVNLRLMPYLFSKLFVFSTFAFIQCVLYLIVLSFGVDYPEQGVFFPAVIEIFITVFITMVSSLSIGLFVSSLARSPDMSMYILVILLFFQFFFSGVIFDLRGKPVEAFQGLTSTHWAMVALGSTIDLPHFAESTIVCNTIPDNPMTPAVGDAFKDCQPYPEAVDDLQLKYGEDELLKAWGMFMVMGLVFAALTILSIKRLDN